MATLVVQQVDRDGLDPQYAAAAGGGDEFVNDGQRTMFHIKNASGGALIPTFVSQKQVSGLEVDDLPVSIPAAGERMIGPFPQDTFNDLNGKVQVTYSGVTSLTVAVIKI